MYTTENKICDKAQLEGCLTRWRLKDETIVFTNGCFDILHLGHVDYLEKAAQLGGRLVVGLNSDESVRKIKGTPRPLQNEYARARILAALEYVEAVILFDEETPAELIRFVKPDVLVKGDDYTVEEIVGHEIVRSYGGIVQTVELVKGYSTSKLIEAIQSHK